MILSVDDNVTFCTIRILIYGYFVLLVSKINIYDIKILFNIDILI